MSSLSAPPIALGEAVARLRLLRSTLLDSAKHDSAPPDPSVAQDPQEASDWSATLETIRRAGQWNLAVEQREAECQAKIDELLAAIDAERRRGDELAQTTLQRAVGMEGHAQELEQQAAERTLHCESLLRRLKAAEQAATQAEEQALQVERWLERMHASIAAWHEAAADEARPGARPDPFKRPPSP